MPPYRTDFIGTGNMKSFCDESNLLFSALNDIRFSMPLGYSGVEPTVRLYENKMEFDFGDCLVFTLNNITWDLSGTATFNDYSATVSGGQLIISVDAD